MSGAYAEGRSLIQAQGSALGYHDNAKTICRSFTQGVALGWNLLTPSAFTTVVRLPEPVLQHSPIPKEQTAAAQQILAGKCGPDRLNQSRHGRFHLQRLPRRLIHEQFRIQSEASDGAVQ